MNGLMKFKTINIPKNYDGISVPIKRTNGKDDEITIRIINDTLYVNNRYMGACLKQIRPDEWWFKVEA